MRGWLPWHQSSNGALQSFHMDCPGADQQCSIVPQKESLKGDPTLPTLENLHGLEIPLRSWRGRRAQKLQPEPTSDPRRDFRYMRYWFRSAGGICHTHCPTQGLKPKSSLCSETSVLTLLAQKPSSLAIPDPQCSNMPALWEKYIA